MTMLSIGVYLRCCTTITTTTAANITTTHADITTSTITTADISTTHVHTTSVSYGNSNNNTNSTYTRCSGTDSHNDWHPYHGDSHQKAKSREDQETLLQTLRSLSPIELTRQTRIQQLQEFPRGTLFVCWGMKVFVEGAPPVIKRVPVVYETECSTTDSYPATGRLYLPSYKLNSFGEKGCFVVRYNGHVIGKDGLKRADVEVLSDEQEVRLEPLPSHSQSRSWFKETLS